MKTQPRWPRFISTHCVRAGWVIHMVVRSHLALPGLGEGRIRYWVFTRCHRGWRWTLWSSNGRIVGSSTEFFSRRREAVRNAAFHGCHLNLNVVLGDGLYEEREDSWTYGGIEMIRVP